MDDLAKSIQTILESNVAEDLINVGSSEEISIKELAILIKKVVGFEGELNFDLSKPDGNPRKLLDSSIIKKYGWVPDTSLEDGLVKTYKWYKQNI